jgi:hypothetical protein
MGLDGKTMFKKAAREAALFLGYSYSLSEFDAKYWRPNYRYFSNLTNPFEQYEFPVTNDDGSVSIVSTSLAELCLFQQDTWNTTMANLNRIKRNLTSGEQVLFSRDPYLGNLNSSTSQNFRNGDARWNNPRDWFLFPHVTDVYRPSPSVYRGVPIPRVDNFNGWIPTAALISSNGLDNEVSNDSFISIAEEIVENLNQLCFAANINPAFFSALFSVNSPGPNNFDYEAMDRISRGVINSHFDGMFRQRDYYLAGNPSDVDARNLWANPRDGNAADADATINRLSRGNGIPLYGSSSVAFMAYFTRMCSLYELPQCDAPMGRIKVMPTNEESRNIVMASIRYRSPQAVNTGGERFYADSVGNMCQLVNLIEFLSGSLPQLLLHSGMSFHNALLSMSFNQISGLDRESGNLLNRSEYNRLWQAEVAARRQLPPGQGGYNVALEYPIDPSTIGTLLLRGQQQAASNGQPLSPVGTVITAVGALLSLWQSPRFAQVIARAPDLEILRQDSMPSRSVGAQNGVNQTIYRGFTPRRVMTSNPILRLS